MLQKTELAIRHIEEAALNAYYFNPHAPSETKELMQMYCLKLRQRVMHDCLPFGEREQELLLEFNSALRAAMSDVYDRAVRIFHELAEGKKNVEVEARLWLCEGLPEGMPQQDKHAVDLWELLVSAENPYYTDGGVNGVELCLCNDWKLTSKNHWLFWDEKEDNWPDDLWMLDPAWASQQHLLYAVHNLAVHCHFSIFDLLHVRKFKTEIKVIGEKHFKAG